MGTEIIMQLAAAIDAHAHAHADCVQLKLQIRHLGGATVYPKHGPYLNLHCALTKDGAAKVPC